MTSSYLDYICKNLIYKSFEAEGYLLMMVAHILSIQHRSYFFKLFSLDCKFPESRDLVCFINHYIPRAWQRIWPIAESQRIFE